MHKRFILMTFALLLQVAALTAHNLVDLHTLNTPLIIDMRYASPHNVFGHSIYSAPRIYLDCYVATRLCRVHRDLAKEGMGLIVYEGYRPPSVQSTLDHYHLLQGQQSYQFNDASHYCKGLGVDVALYYLNGSPLELPTAWGHDCARAYRDYPYLPAHVFHNSAILEKYMCMHGFVCQRERWWHFDLKGWESAPDLDLEYDQLTNSKN